MGFTLYQTPSYVSFNAQKLLWYHIEWSSTIITRFLQREKRESLNFHALSKIL